MGLSERQMGLDMLLIVEWLVTLLEPAHLMSR